jgi:hypothetical protein
MEVPEAAVIILVAAAGFGIALSQCASLDVAAPFALLAGWAFPVRIRGPILAYVALAVADSTWAARLGARARLPCGLSDSKAGKRSTAAVWGSGAPKRRPDGHFARVRGSRID